MLSPHSEGGMHQKSGEAEGKRVWHAGASGARDHLGTIPDRRPLHTGPTRPKTHGTALLANAPGQYPRTVCPPPPPPLPRLGCKPPPGLSGGRLMRGSSAFLIRPALHQTRLARRAASALTTRREKDHKGSSKHQEGRQQNVPVPLVQSQTDVPHRSSRPIPLNHRTDWEFTGLSPHVPMLKRVKPHHAVAQDPEKADEHDKEAEGFHNGKPDKAPASSCRPSSSQVPSTRPCKGTECLAHSQGPTPLAQRFRPREPALLLHEDMPHHHPGDIGERLIIQRIRSVARKVVVGVSEVRAGRGHARPQGTPRWRCCCHPRPASSVRCRNGPQAKCSSRDGRQRQWRSRCRTLPGGLESNQGSSIPHRSSLEPPDWPFDSR